MNVELPINITKNGKIIKTGDSSNMIYYVKGPHCEGFLAAYDIVNSQASPNGGFFYVWGHQNLDIEEGLMDVVSRNSFVIVYPFNVSFSGTIKSIKFVDDGIEIHNSWSHPLSSIQKDTIYLMNVMTGSLLKIKEDRKDLRYPVK
jgi:hypothetical protein